MEQTDDFGGKAKGKGKGGVKGKGKGLHKGPVAGPRWDFENPLAKKMHILEEKLKKALQAAAGSDDAMGTKEDEEPEEGDDRERLRPAVQECDHLRKHATDEAVRKVAEERLVVLKDQLQAAKPVATLHMAAMRRLGKAKQKQEGLAILAKKAEKIFQYAQQGLAEAQGAKAAIDIEVMHAEAEFNKTAEAAASGGKGKGTGANTAGQQDEGCKKLSEAELEKHPDI